MIQTERAALQDRWQAYFTRALPDSPGLAAQATRAAMAVIEAGGDTDAAIAAARAVVAARASSDAGAGQGVTPESQRLTAPAPSVSRPDAPAQPTVAATGRSWPSGSAVVQSIERRTEALDGVFFQVLSLRVTELDESGQPRGGHIPIELRGRSIVGPVARGDIVALPMGPEGRTRVTKTLTNLSTESEVEAKGRPFRKTRTVARSVSLFGKITVRALAIALLAVIAVLLYLVVTGGDISEWSVS